MAGFLKIKLRDAGIRVVYKLIRTETEMLVIVIGQEPMMRFTKRRSTVQKRIIYKKTASLAQNAGDAVLIIAVKNFTAACKRSN